VKSARDILFSTREAAIREADEFKDPWIIEERLFSRYERLGNEMKQCANQVLADWLMSEDENLRFDALVLVEKARVKSAEEALIALRQRLVTSKSHSVPDELDLVERAISKIAE
jgi:hypothetical protein